MLPTATVQIVIEDSSQIGEARRKVAGLATQCGLDEETHSDLAIVTNEMASNLVKHAREGVLLVRPLHHDPDDSTTRPVGIELLAVDRGPGIGTLDRVLDDGYSTAGTRGVGLGAVHRIASTWDLYSLPTHGTIHVARVTARRATVDCDRKPSYAAVAVPAPEEEFCGDTWAVRRQEDATWALVVDGLGHGPLAHEAAAQAEQAFRQARLQTPEILLAELGTALRATRGAAVVVARLDMNRREIDYVGIGNISGFLWDGAGCKRMLSMNGIVGHGPARLRPFTYAVPPRGLVVFYTDGLMTQSNLDDYPDVAARDPGVAAGLLYRDFRRGRDDSTVLVFSIDGGTG